MIPFKYFTLDDQAYIIEASRRVRYAKNDVVVSQGEKAKRGLFIISSGIARVEINGVTIARCGPGSILGELSFLEESGASSSIIANTELEIDITEGDMIDNFCASVPGFATRFYHSLASLMAQRIRERIDGSFLKTNNALSARRVQRTGHVGFTLSPEIISGVAAFKAEMESIAQIIQNGLPNQTLQDQVTNACNALHHLLTQHIHANPGQAAGIGAYIFRQSFPYLMLSYANDKAYTKPLGYQVDYELLNYICEGIPHGDSPLGQMIDEWVLRLPFMNLLRKRGKEMASCLFKFAQEWEKDIALPITVLGIGTSPDVLAFVTDNYTLPMNVTCIDMDARGFSIVKKQLEVLGNQLSVSFVQDSVLQVYQGNSRVLIEPQKAILGANILHYLDDNDVVELLNWIYEKLLPDGVVILGQISETNPDRVYLEYILEWSFYHRKQEVLKDLFARSKFRYSHIEFHSDGILLILSCRKRVE
ncbi:MAG: cyclic nucleotide-binding domain-containing protein [Coleofasciculus sp. G3-WIS-01]|uniref:Crp/Fnr family transcriptional regulator n=1 Tax=Coleofasciculus sp. G3-WIS-01 TaxID=3069528 RepID=UPI0032F968BB